MPFKTVLAKFRGRPGSVVLLSVVDGAADPFSDTFKLLLSVVVGATDPFGDVLKLLFSAVVGAVDPFNDTFELLLSVVVGTTNALCDASNELCQSRTAIHAPSLLQR